MKKILVITIMGIFLGVTGMYARDYKGGLDVVNKVFKEHNDTLIVSFSFRVYSDMLKSCQSMLLFPEVETDQQSLRFPYIQLSGLNRGHMIHRSHTLKGVNPNHEKPYLELDINNETNEIIHYEFSVPYELWMDTAQLVLKEEIWDCAGEKRLYTYSLSQRVELTIPEYAAIAPYVSYIQPERETKKRTLHMKCYLHFPVNQFTIFPDLKDNRRELAKIDDGIGGVKNNHDITIEGVSIIGYASPEGRYESNDRLSYNRATALKEYVERRFQLSDRIMKVTNVPEDWDGLKEAVENSTISGKEQIVSIINSSDDYDRKDQRLKNMGAVYQTLLRDYYPPLRRVECEVDYTIRDYTLDEATALALKEPELLSHYELFLVAQRFGKDAPQYKELLEIILKHYPDDVVACNNYAAFLLEGNEPAVAKHYLDRAESEPFISNNLGVYYLLTGEYDKAEELFYKAKESGVEESIENLKILEQKRVEEKSMQRFKNR